MGAMSFVKVTSPGEPFDCAAGISTIRPAATAMSHEILSRSRMAHILFQPELNVSGRLRVHRARGGTSEPPSLRGLYGRQGRRAQICLPVGTSCDGLFWRPRFPSEL